MIRTVRQLAGIFTLAAIVFGTPFAASRDGSQKAEKLTTRIVQWLVAGPLPSPLPAFGAAGEKPFKIADLLKFEPGEVGAPRPGGVFPWANGRSVSWRELAASDKGAVLSPSGAALETAYLAAWIDAARYVPAKLTISSRKPFQAYLDGRAVASKNASVKTSDATADAATEEAAPAAAASGTKGRVIADLKLEPGEHLLVIRSIHAPSAGPEWAVDASLEAEDKFGSDALSVAPWKERPRVSLSHILDGPKPVRVSVSPDGAYLALSLRQTKPPSDESESWAEIYRIEDGVLVRSLRWPGSPGAVEWSGDGHKFSTRTSGKAGGTIWLADLADGGTRPILEDVPKLGSYTWARDGSFLIYEVAEDAPKDGEGVKRHRGLPDREPDFRTRSSLYRLAVPGGARQRLTAGELSCRLEDISPDNKHLLISRTILEPAVRPYSQTELSVLDLETLETRVIWKGSWLNSAQWLPDGKTWLMLGGPSLFGELGVSVRKGRVPNEYDVQAYLFDPETKQATPLTRDFDPSLDRAEIGPAGDVIFFLTTDKAGRHLYRYSVPDKAFTPVPCGTDVVEQLSVARNGRTAAVIASGPNTPPKVFAVDLENGSARPFNDPGAKPGTALATGRFEPWVFKNKRGTTIDGAIYYPPGFDPAAKYPCIVNYYGGTTPTTASFGGRYPKELWAALGYVVYVLQPSGATGYGQDFSAFHVNDWGIVVADEIIDGVRKFLAAHPFVDPKRVGCIGASYGGFMTELLLTRTDLFAAAVSHAGISSISSYWGEGYWGYAYSAAATAGSFPWNRPDIYVGQSPLFRADKITTPLLLLHGSADTNVPPGESFQLYTALKLLGREVEFIEILDQDHHILSYGKRLAWTKTILAWFDWRLKGQIEWWDDLYPQK